MNTEQNYVGGGNFANTPTQTAQTSLQKPSRKDSRRSETASKIKPAAISILHIDIWFDGGKKGEMNLTAPNLFIGEFLDEQYYYLRQYFKKVGVWMKLEAYEASICLPRPDGTIKTLARFEKVDFSKETTYGPSQSCGCYHKKGGMEQ